MVVWFVTSFGWTEIVFGTFLKNVLEECGFDGFQVVRKCRYYTKGPKPTLYRQNSGLSGEGLLRELTSTVQMEIEYGNTFPDMLIVSDDTDCRIVYDQNEKKYVYNSNYYRQRVQELSALIKQYRPQTKLVFMLAAPEIETWFLADCDNTFCREYSGVTLQTVNQRCGGILPIKELENFSHTYMNDACQDKLSEDCLQQVPGLERYSKRLQGQFFLERLDPGKLRVLRYFFAPAFWAVQEQRDFLPSPET